MAQKNIMSNLLKSKFILGFMIVLALTVGVASVSKAATTTDCSNYTFTKSLMKGSKGAEVTCLQTKLGMSTVTGNYGNLTFAAVKAFQKDHSISPINGKVGPKTRAALNATTTPVVPPVTPPGTVVNPTGPLSVALAIDNPSAGNIVAGQAAADLAHYTFTGAGTLNQVTLQRTGISSNSDIKNTYLFDGVTRISDSASVNTNGVISFNNLNYAISGTKTISVKADIDVNAVGTIGVTMTAYTVSGSTTPTTVSLAGNQMYAVSATMATIQLPSGVITPANTTVNAGTNGFVLWSAPVNVGLRAVVLKSMAFQIIGSAPTDALANVKLYNNGTQIGTASAVSPLGYITFDMSAAPVTLQTGSATLEVRGDVVKGSSRTISLALQNAADFLVADSQLGVNIIATNIPKTAGTITINAGSVTVTSDPTFSATTITGGVTNATLARYSFKAYGEDVKISYLDVTPSVSLDNVSIYANGGQVSGNTQTYVLGGSRLHFTLGSSLIIPANTTVSVEVRADTKYGGINLTSGTIAVTLNGYSNNAQGVNSSMLSTVPATDQAGPSLSVGTGTNFVLSKSSGFVSQNIVSNTANQKVGSYTITAGSYEGVHITNIDVDLSASTLPVTSMSNLYIKYGSTTSTPVGSPQATANNFPVDITVPTSGNVVIDVYADIGSSTTVTNTGNTQAITKTTNTPAANGSSAIAASGTVVLTGTPTTGQNTVVTIGGYNTQLAETTAQSLVQQATALVALINANSNVNGLVTASNVGGTSATITLTANTAGVGGNSISLAKTNGSGITATVSGATLSGGTAAGSNTAQVDYLTPAGVEIGDIFTAGIGSTTVSYTAGAATVGDVVAGLMAAWNGNATLYAVAHASNGTTQVNLTATTAGLAGAFTSVASAANGSHSSTGMAITTTLSLSATGTTSNSTVTSSPTLLAGQAMTVSAGTLTVGSVITTSSPVQQYVIGGTTTPIATYSFTSSAGSAIIDEMRFTSTVSGGNSPLSTLSVNGGASQTVVNGGTTALTNLNIPVPSGYLATNVPVTATWNAVGLGNQPTYQTAYITLTYLKYHVGNTTTIVDPTASVSSNTMMAVASFPTVTVAQPTGALLQAGTNVEAIDVTYSAPSSGPVTVNSFELTTTQSIGTGGTFTFRTGTSYPFVVKDKQGNVITNVNTSSNFGSADGSGSNVVTFTNGYKIEAGQQETFHVYVPVNALTAGSTSLPNIYMNTKLATGSNFVWTDASGTLSTTTAGTTYLLNFPTTTSSVHN